jgi:hypothetical protein
MKKRHITAEGYTVVTVPFWKYKHDFTKDQKAKVLGDAVLGK